MMVMQIVRNKDRLCCLALSRAGLCKITQKYNQTKYPAPPQASDSLYYTIKLSNLQYPSSYKNEDFFIMICLTKLKIVGTLCKKAVEQ